MKFKKEMIEKILSGKKTATSRPVFDGESSPVNVGDVCAVYDGDDDTGIRIKITDVDACSIYDDSFINYVSNFGFDSWDDYVTFLFGECYPGMEHAIDEMFVVSFVVVQKPVIHTDALNDTVHTDLGVSRFGKSRKGER